jgi:hypothetical protein
VTGTSESKLSILGTNVLERHLEVEDTSRNKGEDEGGDHLADKGMVRLDVGVMG